MFDEPVLVSLFFLQDKKIMTTKRVIWNEFFKFMDN